MTELNMFFSELAQSLPSSGDPSKQKLPAEAFRCAIQPQRLPGLRQKAASGFEYLVAVFSKFWHYSSVITMLENLDPKTA